MAKVFLLTRVYDEKRLKVIGLECATQTSLITVRWPRVLVSVFRHFEPNKFKMECTFSLLREPTF